VVEGHEPDLVAQRIDQDGVLRVQVDDGVDILAHAVGPLVQLPLGRGPLGAADDVAVQGHRGEVGRGEPVQPGAGAGDREFALARQPRRQVPAAGQHEPARHRQPADLDQLLDRLAPRRRRLHEK
jgi:hypothetical protein